MPMNPRPAAACLAFLLAAPIPARAQDTPRARSWFATIYLGQWFSMSEPHAGTAGSQDHGFQDTYFVSGLLGRVLMNDLRTGLPLIGGLIDGGSLELEAQLGQHFGLQNQTEATLALMLRSRDFALGGGRLNLAVGEGLSYAFSRPDYEGIAHGEDPVRFLNYLAFEAEYTHPALGGISVVPRIHHRSGVFGANTPKTPER